MQALRVARQLLEMGSCDMMRIVLLCVLCLPWTSGWRLPPGKKLPVVMLSTGTSTSMPSFYHSTDEVLSKLKQHSSNCPLLAADEYSDGGFTNQVYTLRNPNASPSKKLLVLFSIHGREYISSETALQMVEVACGSGSGSLYSKEEVAEILKDTQIRFIPVVNQSGRRGVETGATCVDQRKNSNKVDLNRNFPNYFGEGASPDDETYPGKSPLSEPETKMIAAIASDWKPDAFLDVHAGEVGMGYPYAHDKEKTINNENTHQQICQNINKKVFGGSVWVGRLAKMGGAQAYNSFGSSVDYMYETHKVKYSATWEIYAQGGGVAQSKSDAKVSLVATGTPVALTPIQETNTALQPQPQALAQTESSLDLQFDQSCFAYFNPTSAKGYEYTTTKWADAVITLAKEVGSI